MAPALGTHGLRLALNLSQPQYGTLDKSLFWSAWDPQATQAVDEEWMHDPGSAYYPICLYDLYDFTLL